MKEKICTYKQNHLSIHTYRHWIYFHNFESHNQRGHAWTQSGQQCSTLPIFLKKVVHESWEKREIFFL